MRFFQFAFAFLICPCFFAQGSESCDSLAELSLLTPGPFEFTSIDESDNIRNGPDYSGAHIYYPTNSTGILSSLVLCPGFMNFESTLQNWGPFLSAHGIVTMTIGPNYLTDSPAQRKDALLDAVITLKAEQTRQGSPLFNILDTNQVAVGGFSMGGGGAQLAAASDSSIKAVIALYPFLLNAMEEDLDHSSPLLVISGELDFIAAPSLHANIHYAATPESTPKQRYEVNNAGHDPLIGPYAGGGEVGAKVLCWLQAFLREDHCYCPPLLNTPSTASDFTHNLVCANLFPEGCTDASACNFNPTAAVDDGSCESESCVCPADLNGDNAITVADVLLALSEFGCLLNCTADIDSNGYVNVTDILELLSMFGADC